MLRIKKQNLIDSCLLLLMYFQLVLFEFMGYGQTLNKVVTVLILVRIFVQLRKNNNFVKMSILALVILFGVSSFFSETFVFRNMLSNFLMQFYPLIYSYYIYYLCRNRDEFIDTVLKKSFWLINITMFVNVIVMLVQIYKPFSITAVIVSTEIDYYEDTISGLFAYASTHIVTLFTIFIMFYNLVYLKMTKKKSHRNCLCFYLFFLILISCFIALNNDNKAFFVLFPISLLVYWIMDNICGTGITQKALKKVITIVLCVIIILGALYVFNERFQEFIEINILKVLRLIYNGFSMGTSARGSNERIAMLIHALREPKTWFSGTGFASTHIYTSGYMGYKHFGQSDMGSILFLGGIWYTIVLTFYYIKLLKNIIVCNGNNIKKNVTICVCILFLSTVIYTQCITKTNAMLSFCLIILALRMRFKYAEQVYTLKK